MSESTTLPLLKITKGIGFTGTRRGINREQLHWLRWILSLEGMTHYEEFHHGHCVGADTQASHVAKDLGYRVYSYPGPVEHLRGDAAYDIMYKPMPFLERNRLIVDRTQILIAIPGKNPNPRSGTLYTMRYAEKQGKDVVAYPYEKMGRQSAD